MNTTLKIAGIFTAVLHAGCASYPMTIPDSCPDGSKPLPASPSPETFRYFSVTPPRGGHWCVAARVEDFAATYGKNHHAGVTYQSKPSQGIAMNTMAVMAASSPEPIKDVNTPEQLEKYLQEDVKHLDTLSSHLGNVKIERDSSRTDALCYRVTTTRNGHLSNTQTELDLSEDLVNLVCRHPNQSILVMAGVSERYLTQEPPKTKLATKYKSEIDGFVRSLRFK